ncbi:MAG: SEC-C domain-containing protein [Proteobacteria bacterium]|jgi:hypothetical protein|nr:SEC-C domain-containing protein [Pseudomonadota bacterium]
MQTISLSIVPWRDRAVKRVIEFTEEQTLHDVHLAIQHALDLDNAHLYAFFLNNRAHDPTFEFGHIDSGARHRADESRLGAIDLVVKKRFVYVFDFGDELRHDVQVVGFGRAEAGVEYPRIIESIGAPPPQYPEIEDDEADGDEDWYESDGLDDDGEDEDVDGTDAEVETTEVDRPQPDEPPLRPELEPLASRIGELLENEDDGRFMFHPRRFRKVGAPERMENERLLALDILSAAARDESALDDLSDATDFDVSFWLTELPIDLSKLGKYEEAVDLAARGVDALDSNALRCSLPALLAGAGRHGEAMRLSAERLAEDPHHPQTLFADGVVSLLAGDETRAVSQLREALYWSGTDWDIRDTIAEDLAAVLRTGGRVEDAEQLADEERLFRRDTENRKRKRRGLPPLSEMREGPKIGRNDPCPCGSGRKYKKCCLGKSAP